MRRPLILAAALRQALATSCGDSKAIGHLAWGLWGLTGIQVVGGLILAG